MLIDFSVKNFLSIKEKTLFTMISSDEEEASKIKIHRLNRYLELLPAVTIYGFNASGKSNLIKSMDLLKRMLIYSKINDLSLLEDIFFEYKPFKLDESCKNRPTEFQIRAFVQKNIYDYSIMFDARGIIEEKLLQIDENEDYIELLYRDRDDVRVDYNIESTTLFKVMGDSIPYKSMVGSLSLFDSRVRDFLDWIENDFVIIKNAFNSKDNLKKTMEYLISKDKKFHVKLIRTLSEISYSNIDEVTAETILSTLKTKELDEDIARDLKYKCLKIINRQSDLFSNPIEDFTINTYKKGIDKEGNERNVAFNLFEESEGTIKIYALYAYIYEALYLGKTLVIDEMTSYIHPLVSSYILGLFQNPIENVAGQLITSTHTTDLLELDSLRKDQVYIADKDFNKTTLYSLADIKDVTNTENFRSAYLSGKYGGLNYFRRELHE